MLQSQVRSTQFADFLCNKVLPAFGSFDAPIQTQMLKLLAEVCMFTGTLEKPLEATQAIYKLLMVRIWTILINWIYFNNAVTIQDFPIFLYVLVKLKISQLLILVFFYYSSNKITKTRIQISRQNRNGLISNISHQMTIWLSPIVSKSKTTYI